MVGQPIAPMHTSIPATPAPTVQEPSPEAKVAFDEAAQRFTVDKRGQGDFGF